MDAICLACGARYADAVECDTRFDLALAREFGDPAYGAVHHLTVPAFMLQHNRYSHAGWLWSRDLLARFVEQGLTPAQARQQHRHALASGKRDWSVTRGPRFARFAGIVWSRTIAGVRFDDPETYRADVTAWATAVVRDSAAVVAGKD